MRKITLVVLLLGVLALVTIPAGATDPDSTGRIRTNLISQLTHCGKASAGELFWGVNEFCALKPSASVVAAQIRLPGLPLGVTKGCMWHMSWLMVYLGPATKVSTLVVNQPVEVAWLHTTQTPACTFA